MTDYQQKGSIMKKKILVVVLGLTLCFGMTGCTKGDIESESSTPVWHRKSVEGTMQVLSEVQILPATSKIIQGGLYVIN